MGVKDPHLILNNTENIQNYYILRKPKFIYYNNTNFGTIENIILSKDEQTLYFSNLIGEIIRWNFKK